MEEPATPLPATGGAKSALDIGMSSYTRENTNRSALEQAGDA